MLKHSTELGLEIIETLITEAFETFYVNISRRLIIP